MIDPLIALGHPLYHRLARLVSFGAFLFQLGKSLLRNARRGWGVVMQVTIYQIYFTCIQALPVMLLISFCAVSVFISQADNFIGSAQASQYLATLFVILVVRELAPLLTCLVVVGRSGTAVASELASMKVNEEISALKSMGVDPLYYLGVPRLIGIVVSSVWLSLSFSFLSMFFAMVIGFFQIGVSPAAFTQGVTWFISATDLVLNLVKSVLFGSVIGLVCMFFGFSVRGASTEIPQAITHAVIVSVFWCFLFSAIVTVLVY
jgi:phospholipid/cholesterol/gamma-HCH transport system permease protein